MGGTANLVKRSSPGVHDGRGRGRRQNQVELAPQAPSCCEGKAVQPDGESQDVRTTTGEGDDTRVTTGISRHVRRAGKAGCPARPVVTAMLVRRLPFLAYEAIGCGWHPAFSAPSFIQRRESNRRARAKPAARTISHIHLTPQPEERRVETHHHRQTLVARLEGRGPGFQSAGGHMVRDALRAPHHEGLAHQGRRCCLKTSLSVSWPGVAVLRTASLRSP